MHLYQGATRMSIFMERFSLGMRIRMSEGSEQNLPLLIEAEWVDPDTAPKIKHLIAIVIVCGFIVVTYRYYLHGNEGFWVDAESLCEDCLHLLG